MFNSLKCAETLEEAVVPRQQAEAHVLILSEVLEMNLATKQDMLLLRQDFGDLRKEVDVVRQDVALLEQKLIQTEQRMTIKLGTIVSIAIGVAVTLAKIFA